MRSELETLRWQFRLTWRLAEVHLPALSDEACLWEPAPGSWTVRCSADGNWRPDWADKEPDPAPPATIGWLTWHLIWWWSELIAVIEGGPRTERSQLFWPGSAAMTVRRLKALSAAWAAILAKLDEADISRTLAHPWPEPRPLGQALAWANLELMKNIAEIGCVRHIFEASRNPA